MQRVTVTPVAYALALIVAALIVGGIGNSSHNSLVSELATVALLAGLILLGRAIWLRVRGRRNEQRDPR